MISNGKLRFIRKSAVLPLFCVLAMYEDWANANNNERPNILWLVIEDTSPHQFSCYGSNDVTTPEIDKLANRGILFANASSNAPHCSVERSTLITGWKTLIL